jgi:hypothetical protein
VPQKPGWLTDPLSVRAHFANADQWSRDRSSPVLCPACAQVVPGMGWGFLSELEIRVLLWCLDSARRWSLSPLTHCARASVLTADSSARGPERPVDSDQSSYCPNSTVPNAPGDHERCLGLILRWAAYQAIIPLIRIMNAGKSRRLFRAFGQLASRVCGTRTATQYPNAAHAPEP